MTLTVYHLKTCDTCRKAVKALRAAGHDLILIDVRADGVAREDLKRFEAVIGFEKLLNTRSTTWRGFEDSNKANVDNIKAIDLMMANPTLIKRPVIVKGGDVTIGWTKDVQARWL